MAHVCFFFQAEDGIRDRIVTGVQTCALPISAPAEVAAAWNPCPWLPGSSYFSWRWRSLSGRSKSASRTRSEERRVGKERRTQGGAAQERKTALDARGARRSALPAVRALGLRV